MSRPAKPTPLRHCGQCGQKMERNRYNGTLEDLSRFMTRKYCGVDCMARAMEHDIPSVDALRKRAMKFRKSECQMCGAITDLHIHHMDLNPVNNSPSNLRTFCASCHLKWHWRHGEHRAVIEKGLRPCAVCGMEFERLQAGMCHKHYQRFRKYGDPLMTKQKIGSFFELVRETHGALCGQD